MEGRAVDLLRLFGLDMHLSGVPGRSRNSYISLSASSTAIMSQYGKNHSRILMEYQEGEKTAYSRDDPSYSGMLEP